MKIIDKTPFQNEKGEISFLDRMQGTLKYGSSWYAEVEAQKIVVDQFNRLFEKGFVLIRNLTLPNLELVGSMILIGQCGVYLIYVTNLRGQYEAKGDQWNEIKNDRPRPAQTNLMRVTAGLAKNLERYLHSRKISLSAAVEPVLISVNPGMHIDSMRPIVRVVQSDAIKQFAASLIQSPPNLRVDIYDLAERIVNPKTIAEPAPQAVTPPAADNVPAAPPSDAAERVHAIFNATDQEQPLNPSELDFALQDEFGSQPMDVPQNLREPNPAQPLPPPAVKRRRMSPLQWIVLGFIALIELCIVAGFGYLIFFVK